MSLCNTIFQTKMALDHGGKGKENSLTQKSLKHERSTTILQKAGSHFCFILQVLISYPFVNSVSDPRIFIRQRRNSSCFQNSINM